MEEQMLRKIVLALLLYVASFSANAAEGFSDAWVPLGEAGSGTFLVQSETFIFLAFFVFDANGQPIWFSCQLTRDANGVTYSGGLYKSTGTYYALPWDPSQKGITAVGNCTFAPSDNYNATLTYTLNGGQPIVKNIQRFPLLPFNLAGVYSGSAAGAISGCQDPTLNDAALRARYVLAVTANGDQSATLTFTFVDNVHNGLVCTVSGPLTHYGREYQLNGQASCTGLGLNTGPQPATIDYYKLTGEGTEGHWTGSLGGGCNVSIHFAAVLNVNN
jgi:hypothetical protein